MNRARRWWPAWLGPLILMSGCAGMPTPNRQADEVVTGPAVSEREFFGWEMQPCSQLELDGYPTNISRASRDYYQGPWCAREGSTRVYVWAYARKMSPEVSLDDVRRDVTLDAEQLTLDLAAQGYLRVCGEVVGGGPVDVALEEPGNPQQIRVAALGTTPLSADPSAAQPLSLAVAVGAASRDPAFAVGLSAPPCPPLGTAVPTVAAPGPGLAPTGQSPQ